MALPNIDGSCLARLHAKLRAGPASAVRLARFILESPARVRGLPIGGLAGACGVSPGTVTRFCQALGYAGYKGFQADLAAALTHTQRVTLDAFRADASPETITKLVFECNRQSLMETERVVDHDRLIEVARIIQQARRIVFVGVGDSGHVASGAAQRFTSLGLMSVAAVDPYLQVFATVALGRGDVAVGISHTGQTTSVVEAVRTAREQGARTVALTNYPESTLAQEAEVPLITAFQEHRINAAVSSSRIAQMCIVDCLYFIVGSWGSQGATKLAATAEQRAEQTLRCRMPGRRTSSNKGI